MTEDWAEIRRLHKSEQMSIKAIGRGGHRNRREVDLVEVGSDSLSCLGEQPLTLLRATRGPVQGRFVAHGQGPCPVGVYGDHRLTGGTRTRARESKGSPCTVRTVDAHDYLLGARLPQRPDDDDRADRVACDVLTD